jgi:hypothetical protein
MTGIDPAPAVRPNHKPGQVTKEDHDLMVFRADRGESLPQIADAMGFHYSTVSRHTQTVKENRA